MSDNNVRQEKNIVSGDIAGGDIDKRKYITYKSEKEFPLNDLIRCLRNEMENDNKCKEVLMELQQYESNIDREGILGVEEKLKRGEREDLIIEGMKSKEVFVKKLAERKFYRSAQQIYIYLLGKVLFSFRAKISPLITQKKPRSEIDAEVNKHVLEIMDTIIGQHVDLFTHKEVEGMVYFLTGNCHIRWH